MSVRPKRRNRMTSDHPDKFDLEIRETVGEDFRIAVDKIFQKFISSGESEYSFDASLTSDERRYIHVRAAKYNLLTRSHGKEPNRAITIYKKNGRSNFEGFTVSLTAASAWELEVLTKFYQENEWAPVYPVRSENKIFGKLQLGPPPEVRPPFISSAMRYFQKQLPIYEKRQEVIDKIRNNRVVIISSETGSGKTTQIPQYILDDAEARGEPCRLICTQPRRISTVAVAERVAQERGGEIGDSVGYHIRLESKVGSKCNIVYCTNGVLIRSLMCGDGVLESLTHVIIDEVHERDKLSDFLLICLRESLRKGANIKLILMSATINVAKFISYFEKAEVLEIPGRLFTIQQFFLGEILELSGFDKVVLERAEEIAQMRRKSDATTYQRHPNTLFDDAIFQCYSTFDGPESEVAWTQIIHYIMSGDMPVDYRNSETGMTALIAAVYRKNIDEVERLCGLQADPHIAGDDGKTALNIAKELGLEEIQNILLAAAHPPHPQEQLLEKYNMLFIDEDINYELVTCLISTICNNYSPGAILVFLPGYDDIMTCYDCLKESPLPKNLYEVFFLHGSMNIKDQKDIFLPMPNVRKIILSTNIAETSLTIDDVVYVIDCGRAKVQTYESTSGLSSLQTQWISKACVKQRAGRAGRTQAGICFHLFSSKRYASLMEQRIPEILRVPLEELCLNTKTLAGQNYTIYEFLVMAPDPPSCHAVKTAVENLQVLGALDKEERLTFLGEYLSQLTIHPHLGKMLVYSVFFKCIDPILTIVSALAQKDYFQLPSKPQKRSEALARRHELRMGTLSDHMIHLMAFKNWQTEVQSKRGYEFCRKYYISYSAMDMILKTRSQLLTQMRAAKFVSPSGNAMQELNANAANWALIKAVIASGMYPKFAFKKSSAFCTRTENKVLPFNCQQLVRENLPVWLVYDEMFRSRGGHQVRGFSPVTPLTIALMCGTKLSAFPDEHPTPNSMEIDNWLEFEFSLPQVIKLRKYVDNYINRKLQNPMIVATPSDEVALNILANILEIEDKNLGLSWPDGIDQRPRFVKYDMLHDSQFENWNSIGTWNSNSSVNNGYAIGNWISNSHPNWNSNYMNTNANMNGMNWNYNYNNWAPNQKQFIGRPPFDVRNPRRIYPAGNVVQNTFAMRCQDSMANIHRFSNNSSLNWHQRSSNPIVMANGSNNHFNRFVGAPPSSFNTLSILQSNCALPPLNILSNLQGNGAHLSLATISNLQDSSDLSSLDTLSTLQDNGILSSLDTLSTLQGSGGLPPLDTLSLLEVSSSSSTSSILNSLQSEPEQVPVDCLLTLPPLPNLENSIFLLIRVKQESSVLIAYDTEKWTFSPQTEKVVVSLDNAGTSIYLLFTVPIMHTFHGIAKFLRTETPRPKLQCRIEWLFKGSVPYKNANHLRNTLNNNRLIYEGHDGQEVEHGVAMKLWALFADISKSNLGYRP